MDAGDAQRIAGKRRAGKALAKLDDAAPRVRLTGWLGGRPQRTTIALVYAKGMTCGATTGLGCDNATDLTSNWSLLSSAPTAGPFACHCSVRDLWSSTLRYHRLLIHDTSIALRTTT